MSLMRHIVNTALRYVEQPALTRAKEPAELRKRLDRTARLFFRPSRNLHVERLAAGAGLPVSQLKITPTDAAPDAALLYFHGGGYVFGSARSHAALAGRIGQMTGLCAYVPDYRLAPDHPFPAAFDDALACYKQLVQTTPVGRVIIGGDSAGGGLALALLGRILAEGLPKPAGVFAFSPFTDLTLSGPSHQSNAKSEVMLPTERAPEITEMYLQGADPTHPDASPLWADFTGSPPVWLAASTSEILRDDSTRMAEKLRQNGVETALEIGRDLPHVWPYLWRYLPEARATLDRLAPWIRAQVGLSAEN